MRKLWDIPGGIHPPEHKAQSLGQPLHTLPLPDELILPVSQHLGSPAQPIVNVGDRVLRGQLIAEGRDSISANVHASTSGTIVAIEDRPLPHPSGLDGLCIVLKPDGLDQWQPLEACENYRERDRLDLLAKIQAAGIAGLGGAGFPTAAKLQTDQKIQTLIVNGTECEPYITADDMLMREQPDDIVQGALLLGYVLDEPREILIVIEDNKPEAIAAMQEAVAKAGDARLEVVVIPTKYPSGGEKQLVQILTGQEIPSGKLPAHLGIICQNVGTVLAAWRAVRFGEALVERITTVTGEAFATQRNVRVRLGTPLRFVLEQHGYDASRATSLIMGGPMMGFAILNPDAPVIKTTNCVLAPSPEEAPPPGPPQACIRCGLCVEACPAGLLPQQLYWYARAEDEEKLQAHNLFDCIECGACAYVCPSQIPLVQFYRAAKGSIRRRAVEKQQADRARERFDFRKQRIEEEKAARQRAREAAQAQARQKTAAATIASDRPQPDPAARAAKLLAAAQARQGAAGGANSRARLERNLLAAEERLNRLRERLENLDDPSQEGPLLARIKEAELACQSFRDKLAEVQEKEKTDASEADS